MVPDTRKFLPAILFLALLPLTVRAQATVTINLGSTVGTSNPDVFGGSDAGTLGASQISTLANVGMTNIRVDYWISRTDVNQIVPDTITLSQYDSALASGCPSGSVCDPSTWNWHPSTPWAGSNSAQLNILGLMSYGVSWDSAGCNGIWCGPPTTSDGWTDYEDIVKKIYQHYGPVKMVEVWNEPDGSWFWQVSPSDYATLYYHVAQAIRSVDSKVMIGGPVASSPSATDSYLDALHADSSIPSSWINFISYHNYASSPTAETAAVRDYARNYWPNIPVYVTEWNESSSCSSATDLTGDASTSVGWFGSRLINLFSLGLGADYFSTDLTSAGCIAWNYSSQTLLPKMYVYYLMNKQLGLGSGAASLKSTSVSGLTDAAGAINAAGDPVAVLGNYGSAQNVSVTLTGLANGTYYLQTFLADYGSNHAQSSVEKTNVSVTNGQLTHTVAMTADSTAGVILYSIGSALDPPTDLTATSH